MTRWLCLLAGIAFLVAAGVIAWNSYGPQPSPGSSLPPDVSSSAPRLHSGSQVAVAPSVPVWLTIPAIGVSAPVETVANGPDGTIGVPPLSNHNLAGFYSHSAMPGQDGTSLIVGHIDSYSGPSVFWSLRDLHGGELVHLRLQDGQTVSFEIDGLQAVAKSAFPASALAMTSYPSLRLVTCGGEWNNGHYADNLIVYAHES